MEAVEPRASVCGTLACVRRGTQCNVQRVGAVRRASCAVHLLLATPAHALSCARYQPDCMMVELQHWQCVFGLSLPH
eukprot:1357778-Alexandrium_andersonii.AAC.1